MAAGRVGGCEGGQWNEEGGQMEEEEEEGQYRTGLMNLCLA